MECLILLVFLVIILYIVSLPIQWYEKATAASRKQREFEQKKQNIIESARQQREGLAREHLLTGMKELAPMVNVEIERFRMEIPPRQYENTMKLVDNYVENLEFDKLHSLYNVLLSTNNNKVQEDLNNFEK